MVNQQRLKKKKLEKHIFKRKECKRNWKKSASVCDEHSGQEFDDTYKRLKEREQKKDTKMDLPT